MRKKEMIALLLAGGQGNRLGVLTARKAKPAVSFGGKYRIIDFTMSNCINSGIDTVGVLTQYEPLLLNRHIGIGIPWDLDRRNGGVTILAPYVKGNQGEWYSGTANAVYQNIEYINSYNPEYVVILGTDHIYKMDYSKMLDYHKKNNADVTVGAYGVSLEEATRMGIMNVEGDDRVYEFEEKPAHPKSQLASMGMYIFRWDRLKDALLKADKLYADADFGKHILPMMLADGQRLFAYRFAEYWKDVGTIEAYWAANMELIKTMPEFNLYEDFWRIYTDADHQPPQYTGPNAKVQRSLLSEGCEVYGTVENSVLGFEVVVEEGAIVRDSIIMSHCVIGKDSVIERCVIDENTVIGENVVMGHGENIPNADKPNVYDTGITVIAEESSVPNGVSIGKNCVVSGKTEAEHYHEANLPSGHSLILETEVIA